MTPSPRWCSLLLFGFLSLGCASVDPQPAFDELNRQLAARSGHEAAWARDDDARTELDRRVDSLLLEPLTPDRAAALVLLASPMLQAELEGLGVAQADLAQATRLSNPGLDLLVREPSGGGRSNIELGLVQNLLDPLLLPLRRRLAESELEMHRLEIGQCLLDATAEAQRATLALQAAEQLVLRLELVRDLARAAAELAARQLDAGTLAALDVEQQRALLAESEADLAEARLAAAGAREELLLVLGLSPERAPALQVAPGLAPLPESDPSLDGLAERALATRLDLAAARYGVDLVGRALALRRGTRFFPAGIEVGVSRERETDGARLTGPSLRIELPVFDTGKASLARLEAEHRRARHQLVAAQQVALSELRQAHERMSVSRHLALLHRDTILPGRVRILDQTLRRYNMMLLGVYDLLAARREEVEAEKAYIHHWLEYWLARTDLERALGGSLDSETNPSTETGAPR